MSTIEYRFVEAGKESVKGAFREIGQEARSSKRDVDAALKSFEQLARVKASPAARARAAGGGVAASDVIAETRRREAIDRRAFQDRKSYQERLGKEVAQAQQRREQDAQRVATTAARARAEEDRKQAQLRVKRAAEERAQRDVDHRATLAKTRAQGQSEAQYWQERRRRQHAAFAVEDKAAHRQRELDRERKRINDKSTFTGGIGGQLKGAVIGAGLAAGAVGIGVTGAAARDALRLRELSNRISINSRLPGQQAVDPAVLQKEFENTAIRTPGQTATGIAEALQGFITKTGRADVGRQSLGTFATVASASGADVRDVANAAADLFQKFDITSLEDMTEALSALTVQGKKGAFELKDAAANFSRMSAAASRFGIGTGLKGAKTLGGLSQLAQESTGNAERTATSLEATLRQFIVQSGAIKTKFGVDVFKDKGKTQTNDIQDVIVKTIAGAKGNQAELTKVFGSEGMPLMSPLISTFNKTTAGTAGTEAQKTAAGIAAMRARLTEAIEVTGAKAEIEKDAAQAQQDASAKLTASWERLQSKVGDAVIPMLADLADKFANSPEVVDAFIGTIEVMIEAMKGFILVLEDLGLVKRKIKPPEQIEKEKREEARIAQAEIDKVGTFSKVQELLSQGKFQEAQEMQARLKDPATMERLSGLAAKRNVALQDADKAAAEVGRKQDIQQRIRTPEEFAKEYASLAAPGQQTGPEFAKAMAQRIQARPFEQFDTGEESAAQTEFRKAQQGAMAQEKTKTLGVTGDDQVGKALTGVAAAAEQAKASLLRIAAQGQANPLGPT